MIVEIALLTAKPGLENEVREGLRAGRPAIARMPGYVDSVFHQGLEQPASFVLRIEWETLAAYTESFDQKELLAEWRRHFVHHLAAAPIVMPYETIAGPDAAE